MWPLGFGTSQSTIKRFLGRNMVSAWAAAVKIHLTGHGSHTFNSSMQEAETGRALGVQDQKSLVTQQDTVGIDGRTWGPGVGH